MRFFLAFVASTETTFGPEHHVEDAKVVAFTINHDEGQSPTLSIDIKNLRIGLLNLGRKYWCWLSWDSQDTAGVVPLFFGRLIGIPTNMEGNKVTLSFSAKPIDFEAQKAALAATMRVLPNYDPVFVAEEYRNDSDTVLEGYSKDWHVDRLTGVVTASDIISGEDGTEEFFENEVPRASVSTSLDTPPKTSATLEATVNWPQTFTGSIDMGTQVIESYTGDGLMSDWPKQGASLSGGYIVASSSIVDVYHVNDTLTANWTSVFNNIQKEHSNGDVLSSTLSVNKPLYKGPFLQTTLTDKQQPGLLDPFSEPAINIPAMSQTTFMYVPLYKMQTTLTLTYGANRKRTERISLNLQSDLQPILTDDGTEDSVQVMSAVNGADVSLAIADGSTAGSSIPIVDPARPSYFKTDRGLLSVKYLLCTMRAFLRLSSRCVKVPFDCKFERAVNLSCRKNALLHDRRLPGGQATGKIVSYQIMAGAGAKNMRGKITMACAVGKGGTVSAAEGTATYAAPGLFSPGVQIMTGSIVLLDGSDDLGLGPITDEPNNDGLVFPLTKADVVVSETITGSKAAQEAAINAAFIVEQQLALLASTPSASEQDSVDTQEAIAKASGNSLANTLKNNPISYDLVMKDLTNQNFDTVLDQPLTKLLVPKGIDTQAASNA